MASNLYPEGPDHVPASLTRPSGSFRKHIWIASAALLFFMLVYIGLSSWFLYKSFSLFVNVFSGGRDGFWSFVVALFLGFLGVFMIKALFFRSSRDNGHSIEIKPEDEPELFDFVNRVADEAKAPRPHKIFISNVVNASVSYDVSIINLILPTKKNLEIGLGLVNTLDLGEFKAIVAHEFGHFAQKSMLIGRWVYVAHRVAEHIVGKRDAFDSFLNGLSRVDIRVAWIGWVLSAIVWSIRSISHTLFTLVLVSQRALSREMEFQADLVAVSLTGSDAIVNSLYKLRAADEAYDNAIEFVNKQLQNHKTVSNIYVIQTNAIKHMAVVLNDPSYGVSPKPGVSDGATFRVFKEQIAQAPKMWNTHPSNTDREKNAKAVYIPSKTDERSPWLLFQNPDRLKTRTTNLLYRKLTIETTPLSDEEGVALHNLEFQRSFLLPKYRGIYLSRPLLLKYADPAAIYNQPVDENRLEEAFASLYPDSLQAQLGTLKKLEEEIALLEGVQNKTLRANRGKINYRNREINRKELPEAIAQAKREARVEQEQIDRHNHLCLNVHYAAALKMGKGWPEYLVSVTWLIHFCEHTRKNIEAASAHFYEVLNLTLKTKNLGEMDIIYLLNVGGTLYSAIEPVYNKAVDMRVGPSIIEKMGGRTPEELLEPLKLEYPRRDSLNSWVGVIGGWVDLALSALTVMHEAALDELLLTEEYLKTAYHSPSTAKEAPEPLVVNDEYKAHDPEAKKTVQKKPDFFSRFYHGDGVGLSIGRLAVAASIVSFAIFLSMRVGKNRIIIYNGLPVDVNVQIDDQRILVPHESKYDAEAGNGSSLQIQTTAVTGEPIESFVAEIPNSAKNYVYNVANAAVLYTYTVTYGTSRFTDASEPSTDFRMLGNPRWTEVDADYYFTEPPSSIKLKAGTTETRTVAVVYNAHPTEIAGVLGSPEDIAKFARGHALFQKGDSPHILSWLGLAALSPGFPEIIQARLAKNPLELVSLRAEQDFYTGEEKTKICETHKKLALANPGNIDLQYLQCRCLDGETAKDNAFVAGHEKWKDNVWFAFAASRVYVQREQWQKATACYALINENARYLKEGIAEEEKRLFGFIRRDSSGAYLIDAGVPYITYLNAVESSREDDSEDGNFYYAYKLLQKSDLHEALRYCEPDTHLHAGILRLAAVSDGADEEIINQALALNPTQGFSNATFAPTLALLVKHKQSLEPYKEPLQSSIGELADSVFTFINLLQANKIAEADRMLKPLSAEMKGKFSLLGSLILEERTPARWKSLATGLLFITEKPYRQKSGIGFIPFSF